MDAFSDFDGHYFDSDHQPFSADHPPFSDDLAPASDGPDHFAPFDDHLTTPGPDAGQDWETDATPDSQHLEPAQEAGVIGTPAADMQYWHYQTFDNTCAVVAQESVLESLTGQHFSEVSLRDEAMAHGWYTPSGGTPVADVGNLLEAHGIPVQQETGASLADIESQLAAGHKVIVGVNGEDIWNNVHPDGGAFPLSSYPGIPGQVADHAVEVIGVDASNPAGPMVILNDSGTPDGRGEEVPADVFEEAWSASGDFMMHTENPGAPAAADGAAGPGGARLGDSSGINEDTGNPVEAWGEHYYDTETWNQVVPKNQAP